jgi:hypothetical protein
VRHGLRAHDGSRLQQESTTSATNAQETLPIPEPPFKAKIGPTAKESTPDFPQEFKAPKGSPPRMTSWRTKGLRFNRFHTTALCSRAALMTYQTILSIALFEGEKKMRKRMFWLTVIVFIVVVSFYAGRTPSEPPLPQDMSARCMATVPSEWGEYVGSSSFGVTFKDSSGTLRFVTHFPCGTDAAPHLALMIRRKQ